MSKFKFLGARLTKCDSGLLLNPFLHIFIFITLAFSIAFLFFPHDPSVMASPLFQQTVSIGTGAVNTWGVIGLITVGLHFAGLIIRGKWGSQLMRIAMFGGGYIWIFAVIIYISGGFWLQLCITGIPNLCFWIWYAWNWRKRKNNELVAFV